MPCVLLKVDEESMFCDSHDFSFNFSDMVCFQVKIHRRETVCITLVLMAICL